MKLPEVFTLYCPDIAIAVTPFNAVHTPVFIYYQPPIIYILFKLSSFTCSRWWNHLWATTYEILYGIVSTFTKESCPFWIIIISITWKCYLLILWCIGWIISTRFIKWWWPNTFINNLSCYYMCQIINIFLGIWFWFF
jgi:hypothetical protein